MCCSWIFSMHVSYFSSLRAQHISWDIMHLTCLRAAAKFNILSKRSNVLRVIPLLLLLIDCNLIDCSFTIVGCLHCLSRALAGSSMAWKRGVGAQWQPRQGITSLGYSTRFIPSGVLLLHLFTAPTELLFLEVKASLFFSPSPPLCFTGTVLTCVAKSSLIVTCSEKSYKDPLGGMEDFSQGHLLSVWVKMLPNLTRLCLCVCERPCLARHTPCSGEVLVFESIGDRVVVIHMRVMLYM